MGAEKSQSISSDRISESSIMRAAGNIAAGIVQGRRIRDVEDQVVAISRVAVCLARKIAEEVQRTKA